MAKTRIACRELAVLVATVILCQNCATIFSKRSMEIPVTSHPAGAAITVDGEFVGQAPSRLKLEKNRSHTIRLDAPGYHALEIRIKRKASNLFGLSILGNTAVFGSIGALVAGAAALPLLFSPFMSSEGREDVQRESEKGARLAIAIFLVGAGGGMIVDTLSGANSTLSPAELNVTLAKIEDRPQSGIIFIDADEVRHIKWIRVKLAGSDGGNDILELDLEDGASRLP